MPDEGELVLETNQLLKEIVAQLQPWEQPNEEELADRFRQTQMFKKGRYDINNLASCLSEIELRLKLEQACTTLGLDHEQVFDPIKDGASAEGFRFRCVDGRIEVEHQGELYSDIDGLLLLEDLYVLFEIKLTHYRSKGRGSSHGRKHGVVRRRTVKGDGRVTYPSALGVKHAMKEERVEYVLRPIRAYAREHLGNANAGLVLIISADQINPESPVQEDFKRREGILLPFYTDRKTYRDHVYGVAIRKSLLTMCR